MRRKLSMVEIAFIVPLLAAGGGIAGISEAAGVTSQGEYTSGVTGVTIYSPSEGRQFSVGKLSGEVSFDTVKYNDTVGDYEAKQGIKSSHRSSHDGKPYPVSSTFKHREYAAIIDSSVVPSLKDHVDDHRGVIEKYATYVFVLAADGTVTTLAEESVREDKGAFAQSFYSDSKDTLEYLTFTFGKPAVYSIDDALQRTTTGTITIDLHGFRESSTPTTTPTITTPPTTTPTNTIITIEQPPSDEPSFPEITTETPTPKDTPKTTPATPTQTESTPGEQSTPSTPSGFPGSPEQGFTPTPKPTPSHPPSSPGDPIPVTTDRTTSISENKSFSSTSVHRSVNQTSVIESTGVSSHHGGVDIFNYPDTPVASAEDTPVGPKVNTGGKTHGQSLWSKILSVLS